MLKKILINSLVAVVVILSCGLTPASATTIATFADPAASGSTPLFTINLAGDLITGGWGDNKTGLTLEIPLTGHTYTDAFFTMTNVSYLGGISGGDTSGGTIKFFADGQNTSTTPLLQIDFISGHVAPFSFAATDIFFPDFVTISGSEIGGASLDGISFAFGLGNQKLLNGNWNNGFTATASFTSSAEVPEPATIVLLGAAGVWVFTRKKQKSLGVYKNK